MDQLQKLDIYAMGIILCDLLCNPGTGMEAMRCDDAIRAKSPTLPKGYGLEGTPEGDLLLALVEPDPARRPNMQ